MLFVCLLRFLPGALFVAFSPMHMFLVSPGRYCHLFPLGSMCCCCWFSSFLVCCVCSPTDMRLDVKKSSYKKLSRFLLSMQSQGLIKVKENEKGSDAITEVFFKHPV